MCTSFTQQSTDRRSRKVLTEQLKELEKDGLIVRKQFKEIPPRVEYTFSKLGETPFSHFQ
jgi:DNA-binding HxlR family transcriptional regulator